MAQQSTYSNFGAGHDGWDYNYGLGWTIAGDSIEAQYGVEQAMGFEPSVGGFVTDIWVAISYVPMSSGADTVIIRLTDNPNGLPPDTSDILEEWILTDFSSWSQWNTPIHLVANNTSLLNVGHSYWLWALAKDDTWTMWCMNENASFTCPHTIRRENENWLSVSDETASAFRVDVSTGVGIPLDQELLPASLSQNYPNPFVDQTNIRYSVEKPVYIRIVIYDGMGNKIKTLFDAYQTSGDHTILFDASELSAGMYFYSLQAGSRFIGMKKMNIAR